MNDRTYISSDPLRERVLESLVEDLRREANRRKQQCSPGWTRLLRGVLGKRSRSPVSRQRMAA